MAVAAPNCAASRHCDATELGAADHPEDECEDVVVECASSATNMKLDPDPGYTPQASLLTLSIYFYKTRFFPYRLVEVISLISMVLGPTTLKK